jgi:hypothetical protein
MEKEFVPYEIALELKKLGFDEPCMYYVDEQNNSFIYNFQTHPDEFIEWCGVTVISTPLFQQCFRWFREKYDLEGVIQQAEDFKWYKWKISQYNEDGKKYVADWYEYKTYEEAELDCLKKLIEIVKDEK